MTATADETQRWLRDLEAVKKQMKQFGFRPKCSSRTSGHTWILVYENPFAPVSARHFIGTYEGETELYKVAFESELAARKEFERKAEAAWVNDPVRHLPESVRLPR